MTKIAMSQQNNSLNSVMQRIVDGTLHIDSIEEFEDIIKICPTDPSLYRKFADFLLKESKLDEATEAFSKTARLFIDNGMYLQAIVAKILQWSICKPTHEQGRSFQDQLREKGTKHTPLQRFWASLSYTELVSVMLRLVRVNLDAGDQIASIDDPANEIYFVVSGALAEKLSPECQAEAAMAGREIDSVLLGANDVFGDVLPLEQSTVVNKNIVAITEVELVKISKNALQDACLKHPNIETTLAQMYKPENREKCDHSWQCVRGVVRYGLPTRVEISGPSSQSIDDAWMFEGIAVDISMGGVCLDMGTAIPVNDNLLRKGGKVNLRLDLLNEVATLNSSGTIVWLRRHETDKGFATYIGIRFDQLVPSDQELLLEYCQGDIGEQNLLWGLWDSMVRTDDPEYQNGR